MSSCYRIFLLCGFLLGCSLWGCTLYPAIEGKSHFYPPLTILESNDNGVVLDISGLMIHSALVIDRVVPIETNESINLEVYVRLADKKSKGNLSYRLHVPDNVDTVTIGTNKDLIWSRE